MSAESQEGAGALSHQGRQQVTLRASTDGCQQSVPADPSSSGSHERRKQAPGLAGMMETAEARTAGPAAARGTDVSAGGGTWIFRIGNHSITRLPFLFLLLFSSGWFLPFIPQSHLSLTEGCCDDVSQAVVILLVRSPPSPAASHTSLMQAWQASEGQAALCSSFLPGIKVSAEQLPLCQAL